MSEKKYVAYVGSYTHGSSRQGIHVYDVDVENGTLTERSSVEVSNASHMAVSKNGKYLYSIEDEGVAVFKRDKNGDLSRINSVNMASVCAVDKSRCNTDCAIGTYRTVYSSRNHLYRSAK